MQYLPLQTISAPVLFRLGISPSSSFFLASLRLLSTRPALLLLTTLMKSMPEQGLEVPTLSNLTSPGSKKTNYQRPKHDFFNFMINGSTWEGNSYGWSDCQLIFFCSTHSAVKLNCNFIG